MQIITKEKTKTNDLAVLVLSCDAYSDIWDGFSKCFEKYWPTCPYEVYLVTENFTNIDEFIFKEVIAFNFDSWSERLKSCLSQITQSHILLLLDDYWLEQDIDEAKIFEAFNLFSDKSVGSVRLSKPNVKTINYLDSNDFIEIPLGQPYRISTAPAVWNKDFLFSIIENAESAWQFERLGSYRLSSKYKKVLCTVSNEFVYFGDGGAVARGKYIRGLKEFADTHGIKLDTNKRRFKIKGEDLCLKIKSYIYNLNPSLIVKMQNKIYRIKNK